MNAERRTSAATHAIAAALACVFLLGFLLIAIPPSSHAFAETDNINTQADELQQRIETATAEYDEIDAQLAELEKKIAENTARIDEINRILPEQRARASAASIALYKFNQEGFSLLNALFTANGLKELIKNVEYIDRVNTKYTEELAETVRLNEEVKTKQSELKQAWSELDEKKAAASAALSEAVAAREARAAASQAQAREDSKAIEAQNITYTSDDGTETGSVVTPTVEDVIPSDDRSAYISQWGARINAYLAGSPLAGQGNTFAAAAWDYGVDPRFSPAISCIESTKGAYCFHNHNAWGWGSVDWDSWEEAINSHVRGLARGYGYTVTIEGAQKYCPPNWEFWYSRVCAEMNKI